MAQPFLALITPLTGSGNYPDNTLPMPQPPFPPRPPTGGGGPVDPGYSPPWAQVPVDPGYGIPVGGVPHPSHPIYYPPGSLPHPDNTLPGSQPRPDHSLPPFPSNPIYIPGPGEPPLGIWGPTDPRPTPPIVIPPGTPTPVPPGVPTHPIVLPPDLPPVTPEGGKIDWKTAWTPQTGWVVIGVPAEGTLVPTPST